MEESPPRTFSTEVKRARDRNELKGIIWWNQQQSISNKPYDPRWPASSCRFICYPQKTLRLYSKLGKGPTVAVLFEMPSTEAALKGLRCGLQLFCSPMTANSPHWTSRSPVIPGCIIRLRLNEDAEVPEGKTVMMAIWSSSLLGRFDLVHNLEANVGLHHHFKVGFGQDQQNWDFSSSGKTFKIVGDTSNQVRKEGSDMGVWKFPLHRPIPHRQDQLAVYIPSCILNLFYTFKPFLF
ncbi:hypothetical protein B0T20DRAFT_74973 [Sordaria brevicollis]|uniref:Uncharacterized protein n=1 Tax=Sordaria brevicollis TaxID=83679 RepID=A0AAE0P2H7_SORBR|nr:hypothetical protein B0T20DRAFT_74973 [Sordaria brevicollis]